MWLKRIGALPRSRIPLVLCGPVLLGVIFMFNNCSKSLSPATASGSGTQSSTQILFPGVGSHGIGDPSLAQDSTTSRVWMTYSAVDPSPTWPTINTNVVSTRLAYSDNQGVTWTDSGSVVNSVVEHSMPLVTAAPDGSWINETSQLVYDPGASTGQHFKLIWHHYLLAGIGGAHPASAPQFQDSWLAIKMADSPEQLASATEIKLFASNTNNYYDTNASISGSPIYSPVSGDPAIWLNVALPALGSCLVFSEPGMYATSSALYLTTTCSTGADNWVVLLKCSSPCNVTSASSWTYITTLFNDAAAATYGFDTGFTASSLFEGNDGNVYISVTPQQTSGALWPNYYEGCYVFKFSNIDSGSVGTTPVKQIAGTSGSFNGACAYNKASSTGVMYMQVNTNVTNEFQVFSSGINF